jgi:GxxExxY protein
MQERADPKDPETYAIIGAAMTVHREMGHGFSENVYCEAMKMELIDRAIQFAREVEIPIFYKGTLLPCKFRADFICFGNVIVEMKAVKQLTNIERSQTINYLRATRFTRALLLNFGSISLEWERIVLNHIESGI